MEILSQTPVMGMDPSYESLALKLLVAIIIGFIATCILIVCDGDISVMITGGFTILSAIALFVVIGVSPKVPTDRNEYIVKLDDASFVEIYEKYEVVEQKGDIWILQDKE